MSTLYISETAVQHAERILADHCQVENGWWCAFCDRHGSGRIAAGKCDAATWAGRLRAAYQRQRTSRVPRATFSRPGRRWPVQS